MKLLLDTSVLVDHLRNDSRATGLLLEANQRGDDLWAVVLTRAELVRGMRPSEAARTHQLMDSLNWLDVTSDLADQAGELSRTYRSSHGGIDLVEFTIAAAAETLQAQLMTRNVKHFPMFPDLQPPYM